MLLGMFQINILYSEEVATVCRAWRDSNEMLRS